MITERQFGITCRGNRDTGFTRQAAIPPPNDEVEGPIGNGGVSQQQRRLIEVTPLYRAVDLTRALSLGPVGALQLVDVLYLLTVLAIGLTVAGRRMGRMLCK